MSTGGGGMGRESRGQWSVGGGGRGGGLRTGSARNHGFGCLDG